MHRGTWLYRVAILLDGVLHVASSPWSPPTLQIWACPTCRMKTHGLAIVTACDMALLFLLYTLLFSLSRQCWMDNEYQATRQTPLESHGFWWFLATSQWHRSAKQKFLDTWSVISVRIRGALPFQIMRVQAGQWESSSRSTPSQTLIQPSLAKPQRLKRLGCVE